MKQPHPEGRGFVVSFRGTWLVVTTIFWLVTVPTLVVASLAVAGAASRLTCGLLDFIETEATPVKRLSPEIDAVLSAVCFRESSHDVRPIAVVAGVRQCGTDCGAT